MGASIRIPVTLIPRSGHHSDVHADMIVPKEIILGDGTDPEFQIKNDTDKASQFFICWDRVGGRVPLPPGHDHSDHDHGNAPTIAFSTAAAAPAVAHAEPKHGAVATAAYHHVICDHCMDAEGLGFDSVEVPAHETAELSLKRKLIEPRRGTNPDGSTRIELRIVYVGTLYSERDAELHDGHPRPPKEQLCWLYFIEHPFLSPPHPDHKHRHHSENVILEN